MCPEYNKYIRENKTDFFFHCLCSQGTKVHYIGRELEKNYPNWVYHLENGVCHRYVELFYSIKTDTSLINLYRNYL